MISVGTDIVKVSRIKALIEQKKEKFLNKIFTEEEISYCNSYRTANFQHFGFLRMSFSPGIFFILRRIGRLPFTT